MPSDLQRLLWSACYTVFDRASRTREQRLVICERYSDRARQLAGSRLEANSKPRRDDHFQKSGYAAHDSRVAKPR